jgi:hypothetical protein
MRSVVVITLTSALTLGSLVSVQSPAHARSWLCRIAGIGCPQEIEGTNPDPPSPEPIGFQVCNNASRYALSVAYVTKTLGRFGTNGAGANTITTSQGWWQVQPNQCQIIYQGSGSDVVAVAAQDGTGRFWPERGGDNYCLHPSSGFSFSNQAHYSRSTCSSQGGNMGGWLRIGSTSRFFTYTFY